MTRRILIDSKQAGSRAATRVRIATPQGSVFNGRVGTVVSEITDTGADGFPADERAFYIRLDATRSLAERVLPFGLSEIKEIKA